MLDIFRNLFSTEGFPRRWDCGWGWTDQLGWMHIISDLAIWASYTAIPIVLAMFVLRRKDAPFPRIFWLFVAFIFLCGAVHLVEAIIFWAPVYRLSGVVKAATGVVSVATVCALVPVIPKALVLRSPEQLEREVQERTRSLQQSEAHQRVLMSELDHRVKNTVAAIMSMADQTMNSNPNFADFREAFMGRMMALARTHEALAKSKWAGANVEGIAQLALSPYQASENHPVSLSGPKVLLDSRAASSLCMALHELATNSVKYGSLSRESGVVMLQWNLDSTGVTLQWIERGGPEVTKPAKLGFGTNLLRGMIEHDLDGRVDMSYPREGLECLITIPVDHVVMA